jgi:hypothetical protein
MDENRDKKKLSPVALRALEEAEQRKKQQKQAENPKEIGGRDGPDPVRFGDWETKGIISDF